MLTLQESSLEWALKHVEEYGDTGIFPVPFEYKAIRYIWDKPTRELPEGGTLKKYLSKQNTLKWEVRDYRKTLTPKSQFGFRSSTQLDPLDTLTYLALVYEIGQDIESSRVPVEDKRVFSSRFKPNSEGRMFDPDINYKKFLEHCNNKIDVFEGNEEITYVVVADIADFFPRIYSHPLENALSSCSTKTSHTNAIKRLINNWNYSISYGIPVGQSSSRLLAELVLNDIDQGLISEGADFCRFVDDFRIFCKSKKEAYSYLALLAEMLFEHHGLTLQQSKTKILSVEDYRINYTKTEEKMEADRLKEKLNAILEDLNIDPYFDFDIDILSDKQKEELDDVNLMEILQEQISLETTDSQVIRFVLQRMGQLQNKEAIDLILDNIDKLYTSFQHIFVYLNKLELNDSEKENVRDQLFTILDDSIVGHLDYHKMWLFNTFSSEQSWKIDNPKNLFSKYFDEFSKREIILLLGTSDQQSWFKSNKRYITNFPSWQKRAFLLAANCLPGDEAQHWYKSIIPRLDVLEIAVVKWAQGR